MNTEETHTWEYILIRMSIDEKWQIGRVFCLGGGGLMWRINNPSMTECV